MRSLAALLPAILPILLSANMAFAEPRHGIAMHGEPALPAGFKHFPYVNPDVKKGGSITYGVVGVFDNLNPFILKGMRTTARGMWDPEFGNLVFETLMQRSDDEAFTVYGLLAESVEWDDERSYIQFNLNPEAKWADGERVKPSDVLFTLKILNEKGRVPFSNYWTKIETAEIIDENSIKLTFKSRDDREFPMLLATRMPILPEHATKADTFDQTTLTALIGSGAYRIASLKAGERITYERRDDYWAKALPSKIGFDNYDRIIVDYFLQQTTLFEAFKAGLVDVYPDGTPAHWERAYNFPAAETGQVVKDAFPSKLPSGMVGFVFNTRRPIFADIAVRKALSLAFDFEWVNRSLFSNAYKRTTCFWQNSVLSGCAAPASEAERALLGPALAKIDPAILDGTYKLTATDGSGMDRAILKQALNILQGAGYQIKDAKMVDSTGKQLSFEFMTQNLEQEKMALAYQRTLAALGIELRIRTVDDAQYQARTSNFDYDMILRGFSSSLSPGIEQVMRWTSKARDINGSLNFAGVADPDVDRMIDELLKARDAEGFQNAVRALDRLLVSGHYMVPLYHLGESWVARRSYIARPETTPLFGYQRPTWWDARAQ
jgi:peptide/nickel transport system substrate-binding protein